jgi:hypothetical protein
VPVELNIVESVTELDTTVVTVILESSSEPGPAGPGVPAGGTDGQVLTKTSATDYATAWEDATGGAGGAPTTVDYLVGTAHGDLSAEIVVGTTPGGELGGTWASPTVDATHSGSSHASIQAAAEATAAGALASHEADTTNVHGITNTANLSVVGHAHAGEDITSGTVADARIASTIARDSEVTSAISTSESGQVRDGDTAGGVLGGTYPNPSFAADMATQAELDAHTGDTSAAHAASAVSADSTTLVGTGTDVQAVLEELDNGIADHLADSSAAHAASAISADSTTLVGTGTDVQAVLEELDNAVAALAVPGAWTSSVPTLTAVSVNPGLGTGATAKGRYMQFGSLVIYAGEIIFGTSPSAGTGTYKISLPVALTTSRTDVLGNGQGFDSSTSTAANASVYVFDANNFCMRHDGTSGLFQHNVPWTWAAGDRIDFLLIYEAA